MIISTIYLGTVRSRSDALWQKKEQLEQLQAADGRQRVFWAGPQLVTAANPQYGRFLQEQITHNGRPTNHIDRTHSCDPTTPPVTPLT